MIFFFKFLFVNRYPIGVHVNRIIYWIIGIVDLPPLVLGFDLCSETFQIVSLLMDMICIGYHDYYIEEFDGCLCFVKQDYMHLTTEVWMLENFGVYGSCWVLFV